MTEICIHDWAVDKVAKALAISTAEGERVALSWEGNASFDAFKLLEKARAKMSNQIEGEGA